MSLLKRALGTLLVAGSAAALLLGGASVSAATVPPSPITDHVTPGARVAGTAPTKSLSATTAAVPLRLGTVYRNSNYTDMVVADLMSDNGTSCNGWSHTWYLGTGLLHRNASESASSIRVPRFRFCNTLSLVTNEGVPWSGCLAGFGGLGLPSMGAPWNDNIRTIGLYYSPYCGSF